MHWRRSVAQPIFPPSLPPRPRATTPTSAAPAAPDTPAAAAAPTHAAPNLEAIVRIAHKEGHSDVYLGVGEVPRYRARGEMQSTE